MNPEQPALFDYEKPKTEKLGNCAGGYPWPCGGTGPVPPNRKKGKGCPGCRRICAEGIRSFRASVRAGKYNRAGFTRNEWRAAGYDPADFDNPKERAFRRKLNRLAIPESGPVENS